jgi:dihydropteroate synthase
MGVLNLTPDSFSDGGQWLAPELAISHGLTLLREGADLLDLGAESTRPGGGVYGGGAEPVAVAEELRRLLPVLTALRGETDAPLSVDTRKSAVARAALAAGADLINDISALTDPAMGAVLAEAACPVVLMHSRGQLATMQREIRYHDVVGEVRADLARVLAKAADAGIARQRTIIDPGLGFGKTYEQNLLLVRHLGALAELGRPILFGASRKSFLGHLTGSPPRERLAGSLAAAAWAAAHGAAIVRVHDVAATVQCLRVWCGIAAAGDSPAPAEANA